MDKVLKNPDELKDSDDRKRVKTLCASLREKNIARSEAHEYSFAVSTMFNDLVNEADELSSFIRNVVQARRGDKLQLKGALSQA